MFKSTISKLAIAIIAISLVTVSAFAATTKPVVKHPRTVELVTKWDQRLNNLSINVDARIIWIDLAKQRLSIFQNKNFITSYQILTGKNSTPTPTGTYKVNYKSFKANDGIQLRDDKGKPTVGVSYWAPFIGDSYAFHNASWRQSWEFGNIAHRALNGSHGCVNMSYSDIEDMYTIIKTNDTVYISNFK